MVSHKYKAIFIHIPKTGGSSVEELLWPVEAGRTEEDLWMGFLDKYHNKYQTGGLQHLLASQVCMELGRDVFYRYFKFAIVRNPWGKALSQFNYMSRRPDLREFIGLKPDDCFKRYISLIKKKEHVQWMPQYRFVYDGNGESLVDYLGRFESLEAEIGYVFNVLGVPFSGLPYVNKSESRNLSGYDQESHELIADMYREDIKVFNYDGVFFKS